MAFPFRVSSRISANGSANRILKTQEDAPGGVCQIAIAGSGLGPPVPMHLNCTFHFAIVMRSFHPAFSTTTAD